MCGSQTAAEVSGLRLLVTLLCWGCSLGLACKDCLYFLGEPVDCKTKGCLVEAHSCISFAISGIINGKNATYLGKGCELTCAKFLQEIQRHVVVGSVLTIEKDDHALGLKVHHVDTHCCNKSLCNGVPRPRALPGGLWLSLGPALLQALP